jgi:hypothetical protein
MIIVLIIVVAGVVVFIVVVQPFVLGVHRAFAGLQLLCVLGQRRQQLLAHRLRVAPLVFLQHTSAMSMDMCAMQVFNQSNKTTSRGVDNSSRHSPDW